ncbi:hypothetical protein EG829_12010 [bacterium]|nr:hypothetical protein [bacterium]
MTTNDEIKEMDAKIRVLRQTAQELLDRAGDVEAVVRNTKRILASVRMLELNISDLSEREHGQ